MKTLYITDLDGTFLNSEAEITEKSSVLINKAIEKGAHFTVATARTFATVTDMFSDISLKLPVVLMNGVMVYDPVTGRAVTCHGIDFDAINKVLDVCRKHSVSPLVYRFNEECLEIYYSDTENPYQMAYINKRTEVSGKKFFFTPEVSVLENDNIIYIVTLDKYERLLPLYENIKNIKAVSVAFYRDNYTDCYFLEIFSRNASKASGLKEIKKLINADRVIAFGDNLNDLDMFSEADEAYAVENACQQVKKSATSVIGSNDDDAVAKFIYNNYTENNNG